MKTRVGWMLVAGLAWAATAQAGGHFDVDDAGTLPPGECQYEVWGGHGTPGGIDFFHLGPACRIGAVELGLNLDVLKVPPQRSDMLGPQLKWNFYGNEDGAPLAVAVVLGALYDLRNDGRWGGQLVLPFTWQALESLAVNVNLGVDWAPVDGSRTPRSGLGLDWALLPQLALLAEHSRAFDRSTTRVGLRWSITPTISLDASVARIHSEGVRLFTVGLNQSFSRP
jgi:hypothetical protein